MLEQKNDCPSRYCMVASNFMTGRLTAMYVENVYIYSSINRSSCDVERCINDISDVTFPTVHSEITERATRFYGPG